MVPCDGIGPLDRLVGSCVLCCVMSRFRLVSGLTLGLSLVLLSASVSSHALGRPLARRGISQTTTFPQPGDHTVGDAAFDPGATAGSGLTVSYQASPVGVCVPSEGGTQVVIVGKGMCTVTAEQPGNGTYDPAPPVQRQFTIVSRPRVHLKSVKPQRHVTQGAQMKVIVKVRAAGRKPTGPVEVFIDSASTGVIRQYPVGKDSMILLVPAPNVGGKHMLLARFTDSAGSQQVVTSNQRSITVKF
jgi:hypothetical protein